MFMKKDFFKSIFLKTIWRGALLIAGATISAAGMTLLIEPHNLLSGGVTGASLLISYFVPVQAGILVAVLNIPLFIIAWKKIDLKFCIYSIIGTATLSIAMVLFDSLIPDKVYVTDPLLAALFGGMLTGGGTGLAIRARASFGGTDIVSVAIRQKFCIGIGMVSLYINVVLDIILSLKFGVEIGLLTLFSQFVAAKSMDRVVTGLNAAKAITIVSDKAEDIAKYIMDRMYRGVTFLNGEGAYGHRNKKVVWCIVTTSQLSRVKAAMRKIDPEAFMTVMDSNEVIGKGFYRSPL